MAKRDVNYAIFFSRSVFLFKALNEAVIVDKFASTTYF
jgi:hypothetical protein